MPNYSSLSRRRAQQRTKSSLKQNNFRINLKLEMWANAQRDGRPAEYRWHPLFNAAVWLTPTTRWRAVTLPRCETS